MSKHSVGFFAPRRTRRLAALLPLVLCACHLLRPAKTPMDFELHPSPATDADVLVVLLPGIESVAADFELHGFPQRIQAALPGADVLAVDAHFAYYWQDSLVTRLHEDVLRPRLERYEQVWLLGVSLGGLGATAYASAYPDVVDRILLLAPYLGRPHAYEPVLAEGGVLRWSPPDTQGLNPERAAYVDCWRFHRERCRAPDQPPLVYIGYGRSDRFRVANGTLASAMPPERCVIQEGGHNWETWTPLLDALLERAAAAPQ
ncbi:MAG: alpha/beta fold hydrolase [Planctomycetota bacterium]|nr:alpha/beta fold hydrolase [Planctomycetota bacterium]